MSIAYSTIYEFENSLYDKIKEYRKNNVPTDNVINAKNLYKLRFSQSGSSHMSLHIGNGKSYSICGTLSVRLCDNNSGIIKYRIHGLNPPLSEIRELRKFMLNDINELMIIIENFSKFIKELQ